MTSDQGHGDPAEPINFFKNAQEISASVASGLGAATSLVDYHSHGHCLIIGETNTALRLLPELAPLTIYVLTIDQSLENPVKKITDDGVIIYSARAPSISGHLGAFKVQLNAAEGRVHDLAVMCITETGAFDLILDLCEESILDVAIPPLGYFRGNSDEALSAALATLPELIGDFEKPRYFDYDAARCAHSRSNLAGCSRCVEICATNAIQSAGEGVSIDPYLCQGCGSCALVCPSGAMTYAWPRMPEAITKTRSLYQDSATDATTLLLYAQSEDEQADLSFEAAMPAHVVPIAVEEVMAFGIDYWASMLACGFQHIVVVALEKENADDLQALRSQATVLHRILSGIGFPHESTITLVAVDQWPVGSALNLELRELLDYCATLAPAKWASTSFSTHNDKRQTFRMAIDQLAAVYNGKSTVEIVPLEQGSPFGRINVATEGCTLCMACVSVCPVGALLDGQDLPKLRFIESHCVQCGMCAQGCPENVITLEPRFIVNSVAARETVTLNQEEPFHCTRCHKAFATQKMITTMVAKLANHWMFSDEKAMHRLRMCEDCRVIDMFENEQQGITVHKDRDDA